MGNIWVKKLWKAHKTVGSASRESSRELAKSWATHEMPSGIKLFNF